MLENKHHFGEKRLIFRWGHRSEYVKKMSEIRDYPDRISKAKEELEGVNNPESVNNRAAELQAKANEIKDAINKRKDILVDKVIAISTHNRKLGKGKNELMKDLDYIRESTKLSRAYKLLEELNKDFRRVEMLYRRFDTERYDIDDVIRRKKEALGVLEQIISKYDGEQKHNEKFDNEQKVREEERARQLKEMEFFAKEKTKKPSPTGSPAPVPAPKSSPEPEPPAPTEPPAEASVATEPIPAPAVEPPPPAPAEEPPPPAPPEEPAKPAKAPAVPPAPPPAPETPTPPPAPAEEPSMTDEQEPPATGEEIAALGRPLPQQPEPEPAQSTQAEDSAERLRGVPVPEEIPFFDYFSPENDPKYISFKQDIVTLKQKLSGATSREELEQMIKESNDDEEFHNKLDTTTYAHDHMALSFPLDLTELKTTVYCDANGNLSLEEPVQQAIEETKAKPEVAVGPFGLPLEEKKTETPPPKPPPKKKAEQPKLEPERPEQAPENNLKRLEGLIGINAKSLKTLLEKFATNIDTYIDMNDGTCLCLFKGENYEGTLFVDARNKIPFEFKYKFNDGEEQVSNFRTLDDLEERLRTIAVEKELQSMLSKMNPKNLQEQLDTNNENTTKNIKAIHQIYIGGPLTQKMADSIFNWVKEVKKKLPGEIKKNEPLKDLVLIVDAINSGEIPDPLPQDVIDEARKKSHSKLSSELSLLDPDKGLLEKELTENRDATLEKINGFLSRIKSRFPLDTESMFSDIRDWVEKVKNHSEIEEFKKCGPLNELILFVDANKKSTDDEP